MSFVKLIASCAVVLSASLLATAPSQAKGSCTFKEASGKEIVQPAQVHGAMGSIWINWGNGGRTNFAKISSGSFVDEGGNSWILLEHWGATLKMRRSDGAIMNCYSPW